MRKIKNIKLSSIIIVGVIVTTITGCNNEDYLETPTINQSSVTYLDLVDDSENLSRENIKILNLAEERIKPYIQIVNGKAELTISSGEEIKISRKLFNTFVMGLKESNKLIDERKLCILNNQLYPTDRKLNNFPRLRSGGEIIKKGENYESVYESHWWGWDQTTTYNNQDGALDYYKNYDDVSDTAGTIAGIAGMGIAGVSKTTAGAFEILCQARGLVASEVGNKIFEAARQGSITVQTTQRYGTGFNGPAAPITSVYDNNGKLVVMF